MANVVRFTNRAYKYIAEEAERRGLPVEKFIEQTVVTEVFCVRECPNCHADIFPDGTYVSGRVV